MIGWLIYSEKDIHKNRFFIEALRFKFLEYQIDLKLIIYETVDYVSKFQKDPPFFALNRSRFYKIAVYLENNGVRVFNNSSVTKITNNKLRCYEYFKDMVPCLKTFPGKEYRLGTLEYPIVLKSCSGHGGTEVFPVYNQEEELVARKRLKGKEYLVQQCCDTPGKDVRIYILGNEILSCILRFSKNFHSNYGLGGQIRKYQLNKQERSLVDIILQKMKLDYAGIDFIFHQGHFVLNEIEDAVGARMLYRITDIDVISRYVRYILDNI